MDCTSQSTINAEDTKDEVDFNESASEAPREPMNKEVEPEINGISQCGRR